MSQSISDLVVRSITSTITIFSRPFSRYPGVPVGSRSTAIKLEEGENKDKVWVLASSRCDEVVIENIKKLGQVKYLVAPDTGLNTPIKSPNALLEQYIDAFPDAKVIGVDGLQSKASDVKFDYIYGQEPADKKVGYEPEIQVVWFDKFINRDLAFFHQPTKTLVQADLLFNLPGYEQYSNSKESAEPWVPFVQNFRPGTLTHRIAAMAMSKNDASDELNSEIKKVYEWDFDRIIPSHGDVIETGGKKAWYDVFSRYLPKS
ncbi:hypothetical protein E3Q08_03670 [Wallemia mellicola]|uniref:Uncharacterized protein n=1 Tax=Wallemia mellicola TaxID=1708541 RepID=A0AB74KA65_9BASI|nr:hypothetical protein E3Q24_03489 [Wallemia mellicola]TIB80800.1 hypothetical protein E3Q21_03580 [Wallemia mellicola]TIB84844.1 hypothetical protein E3Q20_03494 [Wallemia mellicola]TIC02045.1 hypothetical protein E3Q16_03598 [Wallemia mellicola]TIC21326.1 hypothetical protein E3Q12_03524 [Wallemia mellicola]